ncbi:carbohydrate kinase family protein [Hymenobacter armeniacus]|uniref:Carbohydrate kinase n=1 Tax=Hymenobacter armeniacus TaxID=2771358 RepID=A0ABR8JYC7_9BACT|nr:carbohydrate kinase [Hymenobacter armeniacus]MBD2722769.1 carbohydrate kinase [Hymenobacter armeniacus]
MDHSIICFGEMLWDVLPTGKQPGGAPMNVAVHLRNLGLQPRIVSRVGDDQLGQELLAFVETQGLSTDLIQRGHSHLTGVVKANVGDRNEVVYKIVQPVAWDYIQYDEATEAAVDQADVFVYGSLAARSPTTADTLFRLLERAPLRVFDVNLRAPHYDQPTLERLLATADLVKLNHHELDLLAGWYEAPEDLEMAMLNLARRYALQTLCVTCGEQGAVLYTGGEFFRSPGFPVEVKDTIGSGDSFLAALLRGLLQHDAPAEALRFACAAGAVVATHQGATPPLREHDIRALMAQPVTL